MKPWLPPRAVLERQDAALSAMRSRVFRRIGIGHRGPVLDLGAGPGVVTAELSRRSRGPVVALDRDPIVNEAHADEHVVADATNLPFDQGRFSLVYAQYVFLWNDAVARRRIAAEIVRVLSKDGVVVAIEPDWGGALEHPPSIAVAEVVAAAIARAGGEPFVGRKVPLELARAGLSVRVEQVPELGGAEGSRFDIADGLPLTDDEKKMLDDAKRADSALGDAEKLVHVPQIFVTGTKR